MSDKVSSSMINHVQIFAVDQLSHNWIKHIKYLLQFHPYWDQIP